MHPCECVMDPGIVSRAILAGSSAHRQLSKTVTCVSQLILCHVVPIFPLNSMNAGDMTSKHLSQSLRDI